MSQFNLLGSRRFAPFFWTQALGAFNDNAFRNAMVPVITVIGLQFALLLGGAILTEQTFNWPGIGQKLVFYINNRDYGAVQGIVTFFAIAVVLISLLVDIVNALIDPRVRY